MRIKILKMIRFCSQTKVIGFLSSSSYLPFFVFSSFSLKRLIASQLAIQAAWKVQFDVLRGIQAHFSPSWTLWDQSDYHEAYLNLRKMKLLKAQSVIQFSKFKRQMAFCGLLPFLRDPSLTPTAIEFQINGTSVEICF